MRINLKNKRRRRGYALLFALGLIMGLSILVAAVQRQVVQNLALSRTERDYERALQMAEAGANAYINLLVNGAAGGGVANNYLIPPVTVWDPANHGILTAQDFKTQVKNGAIPVGSLVYYPAGQT